MSADKDIKIQALKRVAPKKVKPPIETAKSQIEGGHVNPAVKKVVPAAAQKPTVQNGPSKIKATEKLKAGETANGNKTLKKPAGKALSNPIDRANVNKTRMSAPNAKINNVNPKAISNKNMPIGGDGTGKAYSEKRKIKNAPDTPKVKRIENINAGNKNNSYRVPNKKSQQENDSSILESIVKSEKVQTAAKETDRAIGKAYRATKKISQKDSEKKKKKKQKDIKYAQGQSQEMVPIKEIKYGIIKTTSGMYVKILEILPIDYYSFEPSQKNRVINNFRLVFQNTTRELHIKVINDTNNPRRITDYIKQRCEEEKYQRGIDKKVIACAQDKIDHINNLCKNVSITSRYFLIYKYEGKSDDINEIYGEIETMKAHFTNVFKLMGNTVVDYSELSEETFGTADILYYCLNKVTSRKESLQDRINRVVSDCSAYNAQEEEKREVFDGDFLASKGIKFIKSDYIFQDGMYKTWLGLKREAHPSSAEAAWVNILTSFGAGNELDIITRKLPKQTARYLLSKKVDIDNAFAPFKAKSSQKWKDFAPKAGNVQYILNSLEAGEDLFEVIIIITLTSDTIRGLRYLKNSALQTLNSKKLYTEDSWQYCYDYYKATLPLMEIPYALFTRLSHNYLTHSLQSLYPFTSYELVDPTGYVLGVRSNAETVVAYNNFNTKIATNANMAIVGTSGAGKTYSTEVIARSMRVTGIRTMFILPVKGFEYERGCKAIGGSYIRIGPGKKDCINIMAIRPEQSIDKDALQDNIAYSNSSLLAKKIGTLTTFLQLLNSNTEFSPEIFSTMSSVLTNLYGQFGITNNNSSIWEDRKSGKLKRMPVIADMYNAFMEVSILEDIGKILLEFISGAFSNFNGQTNVDLDNYYLCFDVDEQDMQKKYLPACLYIAFDCCYGLAKQNRLSKDMIFFDEVWKMLITDSAAEQVRDMAKLIRGYGGGVAFATQELNDFMNNSFGASILANCDSRLILKLKDNEIPLVLKHIKLTQKEQQDIIAFDRGQALLLAGRNRIQLNICASEKEDRDFTTDPNRLRRYAEEDHAKKTTQISEKKKPKVRIQSKK